MKKVVAIFMLIVLVFSFSNIGFASSGNDATEVELENLNEVIDLREKNSETYRLEDGSYECVVFAEDKYFEDETGKLVEINNAIVPEKHTIGGKEYGFVNEANSTRAYFSENEPEVLVYSEKNSISFGLETERMAAHIVGGLKDVGEVAGYPLSGDNMFAYTDAFESTDIVYEVGNGAVKEYIILNDDDAPSEFTFSFDTEGYTAAYTECGTVGFYDCNGELAFELCDLFAIDSEDVYTEDLAYSIGETVEGRTLITITISEEYANAPERAYPILIDPSIMITGEYNTKDTYVSSRYPTTNYYMNNYLKTGRDADYYIRRTYIKFDLPASLSGTTISSAYINIKMYTGSTPSINAYRVLGDWTSSTLNWNNKPSFSTANASGAGVAATNNWYKLYVTSIVSSWTNGTYSNYGFMIKDATETGTSQWTAYYSSDAASPNKPELRVTYMPSGSASYIYYINNKFWGKYLHKSSDSSVNPVTGLISNYGSSIRWKATYLGDGKYTLNPESDSSRFLIDDVASGGICLSAAPSTETIPNKYLWSITSITGGGKLIKNLGTNRYISESSATALTPVTNTGTEGSDAYNKCVWRVATSSNYGNNSNYNQRELSSSFTVPAVSVNVGQTKTIAIGKEPSNAIWADPSDFTYSFSSGTSGLISINTSTGKITGIKKGIATYTATHKVTGRSKTFKIYVDKLTEVLAEHFGFEDSVAILIREVYDRIDEQYQNDSVKERAWKSSRILSTFSYNTVSFNLVAGSVVSYSNLQNYFVNTLHFSASEYTMVHNSIISQHANTNTPDFSHEQYSLAARLAYDLGKVLTGEEASYLAGWLGDATLCQNGVTTSFKNDDYCADLDAENIFRIIQQGNGIVYAYKSYHNSLTSSNTRAVVFKTHISFATVKKKVYDLLIDNELRYLLVDAIESGDIYLIQYYQSLLEDEEYHQSTLHTDYPDTYSFLHSLELV